MDDEKRTRWRRILRTAYQRPVSQRWRKHDVSAFPGWAFDLLVIVLCVTFALLDFFGVDGLIAALFISLSLFRVMDNKKKSARKAEEIPAPTPVAPAATTAATAPRQPLKVIRVEDCSVSIWMREFAIRGAPTKFLSLNFERSYKDRSGQWRYTRSFDPDDLGKICSLCQQASEAIPSLVE